MGKGTLEVLLVDAKGLADTDFLGKLFNFFCNFTAAINISLLKKKKSKVFFVHVLNCDSREDRSLCYNTV